MGEREDKQTTSLATERYLLNHPSIMYTSLSRLPFLSANSIEEEICSGVYIHLKCLLVL